MAVTQKQRAGGTGADDGGEGSSPAGPMQLGLGYYFLHYIGPYLAVG